MPPEPTIASVTLQSCPYDSSPITAEAFAGGFVLLSCERCGATWESHNSLVRRIVEPDWDEARAARIDQETQPSEPGA